MKKSAQELIIRRKTLSRACGRWVIVSIVALAIVNRCLSQHPAITTTIYVGKHFEVRDHDAPVKYIFDGDTRVARVSGSLSSYQRNQRLRVSTGWNLCSLAVTATNALAQLSNSESPPLITTGYKWNSISGGWDTAAGTDTITAGSVLWLNARTNATLCVVGTYPGPASNLRAPPEGAFLSGAGLEVFPISTNAGISLWSFDALDGHWDVTRPAPPVPFTEFPSVIAPGQAFYAQAPLPVDLELPDPALSLRYYNQDHLGSSSCLTDAQGNLVEEAANYPFGHPRHHYQPKDLHEPYQFTQKERDAESGLHYFEARLYAARLSRFSRVDPLPMPSKPQYLRQPGNLNTYAYCKGNPVRNTDPDGMNDKALPALGDNEMCIELPTDEAGMSMLPEPKVQALREKYDPKTYEMGGTGGATSDCSQYVNEELKARGIFEAAAEKLNSSGLAESGYFDTKTDISKAEAGDILYFKGHVDVVVSVERLKVHKRDKEEQWVIHTWGCRSADSFGENGGCGPGRFREDKLKTKEDVQILIPKKPQMSLGSPAQ